MYKLLIWLCSYRIDLPGEGYWCLCYSCWGPIGIFSSWLGGGSYIDLLIGWRWVYRLSLSLRLRLSLRWRWRLRLRPLHLTRRRPGSGLGRSGFGGDVCQVRLGRQVFELGFGWQVPKLRFRREVRELRLGWKFSGFGREFRRLRFGGQVSQLGPVRHRSLLWSVCCWRWLLEDLRRLAGLIHRRVVYGVNFTQCH